MNSDFKNGFEKVAGAAIRRLAKRISPKELHKMDMDRAENYLIKEVERVPKRVRDEAAKRGKKVGARIYNRPADLSKDKDVLKYLNQTSETLANN